MAGPDPIARAECAQYLYRSGVDLSALAGSEELRTKAVALLVGGGFAVLQAQGMVDHLAERYAP